ncbi:MAG: DUF4340 domain-containing protein, partial [Candidatus Binatia bacterium]
VALADGTTLPAIRVGATAPVGFSAYAQLEGSPGVKLVPSVFQTGMKKEVKDLRNKVVIDFQDEEVQRITVADSAATVALARDGSDWKIEQPQKLKADPGEVRSFLSSLRGMRAQDFIDQPSSLAEYGLDSPRKRIAVVVGKDETRKEILIGAEKEKERNKELYVKRADGDTVYAVGSWVWNGLNKTAATFRDKTVLTFDLANLASVEVARRDGNSYRVVRDGAGGPAGEAPAATPAPASWKLEGVATSKGTLLNQLVGDLHGLKGYEIAAESPKDLGAYGLASPDVTFSLADSDGKPIGRILASRVGESGSANHYAMAEGGNVVLRLREYLYAHLDKKKSDFLETPPTPALTPLALPGADEGDEGEE